MDYSPFNPIVWALFLGFAAATWLVVRVFSARHQGYPGALPEDMTTAEQHDAQESQSSTAGSRAGKAP